MALSNRDRVGRALDILSHALNPFISRVLAPHLPKEVTWTSVLAEEDRAHGLQGKTYDIVDVQGQLRVVTERLGALGYPFRDELSPAEQNLAGELSEIRKRWAHNSAFSSDDTYRALDTTERLLRAIGAVREADSIKGSRSEHQRTQYESETRRDSRALSAIPGLGDRELKPWREVLKPHADVLSGRFKESEFAADLYEVAHGDGSGSQEYQNPVEFFRRTYLTSGLQDLLTKAAERISGDPGAAPVVNLQTTFGGGKTHSMLAVWHLFSETPITDLPQGVQELLSAAGLNELDRHVRRVAIVGNEIPPGQATIKPGGTQVHTLWGEIAWQLGGAEAYALLAESDQHGTSPGAILRDLLQRYSPCVILIDEWVAYARQLHSQGDLPAGTFETQFSFAQVLTEAVKATPGALLLVSIPASDLRTLPEGDEAEVATASDLETGGAHGKAALQRLEHVVSRIAHHWQPASSQESFEIVRRRLFEEPDAEALRQISATARRFVSFYRDHAGEFPKETTDTAYEQRIKTSYPIHPELFARLYEDWSTLERFQRTRGVLRLMSSVVQELYEAEDEAALIMPGSVPIASAGVLTELSQYVEDAWKVVIDTDIDGPDALPRQIDEERPLFGKRALTRRIARAAFLGSAATLRSAHKGIERKRMFLGVAVPGDTVGNFGSSLQMLSDRATYLFNDADRYWYDLQPSLNRLVADRAVALHDEDAWVEVIERLKRWSVDKGADIAQVVVAPLTSGDVPEAEDVRLVLFHPMFQHVSKSQDSPAIRFGSDLTTNRGSAQRDRRNTVVGLAPDEQRYAELDSAVRTYLAWKSVSHDIGQLDLTQQQAASVRRRVDETNKVVDQRIGTTWTWAIHPIQPDGSVPSSVSALKVEGDEQRLSVRVGRKLVKEDILRVAVAPASIEYDLKSRLQRVWNNGRISVGELWDYYTKYPYLPRLRSRSVLVSAIDSALLDAGWAEEGFALATGYNEVTGEFAGLAIPLVDEGFGPVTDTTLLVSPHLALAQQTRDRAKPTDGEGPNNESTGEGGTATEATGAGTSSPQPEESIPNGVYVGRFEVDSSEPEQIADQLKQVAEEVLQHLARSKGLDQFEVIIDIRAENSNGFEEATVRTVNENARVLGFDESQFEDVDL